MYSWISITKNIDGVIRTCLDFKKKLNIWMVMILSYLFNVERFMLWNGLVGMKFIILYFNGCSVESKRIK